MQDILKTVISQYSTAPTLRGIIESLNSAIDTDENLKDLFDLIWNVDTAGERGLEIWARIVAANRQFKLPPEIRGDYFGFIGSQLFPFNDQPFYNGQEPVSETYTLYGEAFRWAILVKALTNISASDAPSINRILLNLFEGRGDCYVLDRGSMMMLLRVKFELKPYERAIIGSAGYMLRPAGVLLDVLEISKPCFGFCEANQGDDWKKWDAYPFNEGIFLPPLSHWTSTA